MTKGRIHIILLIFTLFVIAACNPQGKVQRRGGYLLVQNTIKNKNPYLPSDELEGFIQQNSMEGSLAPYFRPGIFFYERSEKGKETKFNLWVRRAFSTKPVILDTMMIFSTRDKLQQYLVNKGFYHATVNQAVKYSRKTARVTYSINSGPPCIVNKFDYFIPDSAMYRYVMADTAGGQLRKGMIFDTYILDDERERIAINLRNNSYYTFSLSDIYYVADTSKAGLAADVELHFRKVRSGIAGVADSTIEINHPRFYIRNIYINPDADLNVQDNAYDTIPYKYHLNKADTAGKTIYVLTHKKSLLKPSFLASSLSFAPGDAYSQSAANSTYKKLISQPIIGSANVNMSIQNPGIVSSSGNQALDCNIRLKRNKLNTFSVGTEGTNSGGRFGVGLNSAIQNRNIFRGAEVLSFKIKASAEIQGGIKNPNTQNYFLFFNTLEGGAEVSIDFPRLIIPYRSKYQLNTQQGRTSLSAGIGFELQTEYTRDISSLAWSYKWSTSERVKHIFTPFEFNYIKIFPSDSFSRYLESLTDPVYKSQYTDHLLTMIRYSIIISNMGNAKINNQFFLRMNAETSGNIPYLVDNLKNNPQTENGYYERLGVRYSQFARLDFDFRKFWKLRRGNFLAFRFMGGSALPYGNSDAVPFEKSFWLGGANDMRGWRLRSLGPGGYVSTDNNYNKTGEIMLQSSLENRFPIYSFLLGSFFVDAGNVWLRRPSVDFPDGEFKFDSFYKQIAMDLGFGLRFDFSFFILRLDAAVPFHDPTHPGHWFSSDLFNYQHAILNFGIGYPF